MRNKPRRTHFSKGVIFSIFLHLVLIGFIVFWGVGKHGEKPSGPIEVSLSTGDFGGGGIGSGASNKFEKKVQKKVVEKKPKVEKKEVIKKEPPKKEIKEEIKEPEKKVVKEEVKEVVPEKKIIEKKEEPKKEEIKPKEIAIPEEKAPEKKEVVKKKEPEKKKEEVVKKEEPKKKEEPVKKAEKKEEKIEKEEPEKEVVKKTESSQSESASREEILKEMKRKAVLKRLKGPGKKPGNSTQVAKNNTDTQGSGSSGGLEGKGGSGGGGNSRINPVVLSTYYEVLSRRVDRVLAFPPNVELDGSYKSEIRFWMNENGRVYGVAIHKTSGNNIIDNNCVKAVNSAAPFPSPPIELRSRIKKDPFVIPCSNKY